MMSSRIRSGCSSATAASADGWLQHRSEEHTSELQSHSDLVCRLLLEKKNDNVLLRQICCSLSTSVHRQGLIWGTGGVLQKPLFDHAPLERAADVLVKRDLASTDAI